VPTAAKQTEIPDKIQHEKRKFHKKVNMLARIKNNA
jgi:hypothetical protein